MFGIYQTATIRVYEYPTDTYQYDGTCYEINAILVVSETIGSAAIGSAAARGAAVVVVIHACCSVVMSAVCVCASGMCMRCAII